MTEVDKREAEPSDDRPVCRECGAELDDAGTCGTCDARRAAGDGSAKGDEPTPREIEAQSALNMIFLGFFLLGPAVLAVVIAAAGQYRSAGPVAVITSAGVILGLVGLFFLVLGVRKKSRLKESDGGPPTKR